MRIFLSYASERRAIAETIALALRNQGHRVFFDRDDLPPGASYDEQIRNAIAASDLLIFLISPESVADGRYTLTELALARRRWAAPEGRVLPVHIVPTPLAGVPAYLRAVTILEPRGNVAAEVAAVAAELAPRWRRWRWPAVAATVTALVAGAVGIWQLDRGKNFVLEALPAERVRVGLFGEAPTFRVGGRLHNRGRGALELNDLELETDPPLSLRVASDWSLPADLEDRPGGSVAGVAVPVSLMDATVTGFSWRLCARLGDLDVICSSWQAWDPKGTFAPSLAYEVPAEVRRRAVLAVAISPGFVLALQSPPQLVQLAAGGEIGATAMLSGEPAAMADMGDTVFVATRLPNALAAYRAGSLEQLWTREITFAGDDPATAFDEPPSTSPVSIAGSEHALWLLTGGGTGGAVIAYLGLAEPGPPPERLIVPPYQPEVAFDLRDMHLVAAHGAIWGAVSNTTPASLYRFDPETSQSFAGHDFDIVQCASDLAGGADDRLLILDCEGSLAAIKVGQTRVESVNRLGRLIDLRAGPQFWDTERLAAVDDLVIAASDLRDRSDIEEQLRTTVARLRTGDEARVLLELENTTTRALALGRGVALLVLERSDGRRDAIVLDLDPNPDVSAADLDGSSLTMRDLSGARPAG